METVDFLEPSLDAIFFTEVNVRRKVDNDGVIVPMKKGALGLEISGRLGRGYHPVKRTPVTVAELRLKAETIDEEKKETPVEVLVVSHSYFKHREGTSEADIDAFNDNEEHLTRLLMQVYPATLHHLKARMVDAGVPHVGFPSGMPPREKPEEKKKPARKRAKKIS